MSDELKPCPFCGSDDIDPRSGGSPECYSCGAKPGSSDWNERYDVPSDTLIAKADELAKAVRARSSLANIEEVDTALTEYDQVRGEK